ncbi:hypothetical protein [Actinomadura sp. NPDC048394]|uniref:hypothetical protein n=1 Tax=Actinomadura sp. NPDC048394 TaxID=3158223 RepID=UPI003405D76B
MSNSRSKGLLDAIEMRFRESRMATLTLDEPREDGHRISLERIRELILDRGIAPEAQDAVWRELVTLARKGEERWQLAAIWMMLPGLRKIVGRCGGGRETDYGEVESEAVAGFLEELHRIDARRPRIGASLWWAARRRAAEVRLRRAREIPSEEIALVAAERERRDHEPGALAEAVHEGVISVSDARLINETRLEGERLGAVAERMGLRYHACHQRRARAEGRLAGYLLVGGDKRAPSPPGEVPVQLRPEGDAA